MKERQMDECILAIMNKLDSLGKSINTITFVLTKNQQEISKLIKAHHEDKSYDGNIKVLKESKLHNTKKRSKRE